MAEMPDDWRAEIDARLAAHEERLLAIFDAMRTVCATMGIRVSLPEPPECDRPPQNLVLAIEQARLTGEHAPVGVPFAGKTWVFFPRPDYDAQEVWDDLRELVSEDSQDDDPAG